MYRRFIKRLLDIVLSACALAVLLPFLAIIAVLVRFKLGSPVIFRQDRPGKDGRIFTLHKFRTMTDKKDDKGEYLPDAVRLTRFGKFLRAASLDELPELWNIIKGDMSLVGPRPLLVQYLPLYNAEQQRRHLVRPGLTGWAQVNGRNAIKWEEKFKYDVFYVDNVGFLFDMKIIWLTFVNVIRRKDINSSQSETMPFFTGS